MFENIYKKKYGETIKTVLLDIVMAFMYTLAILVVYCLIFGYKPYIVLTGSMNPTFYPDDIVLVQKQDEYQVGDILTCDTGANSYVTHRLIEIKPNGNFVTQGDANPSPDGERDPSTVVGKVVYIIPKLGTIYSFLQENWMMVVSMISVIIALGYLVKEELYMWKYPVYYERFDKIPE